MMANMSDLLDGNFIKLIILNTTFLIVLLRAVFFRFSKDRESLFGFFIFGSGVFPVSYTHLTLPTNREV